ncbi:MULTISPECIES: glucokinase [Azospirillaceae]|uniref:glucokinase n=1 Tax=Azospirillaceae TaxID=2829815 RepID=UPI000B719DE1|nr:MULTISPECIES: glucokinase [Azospirillaceae]MDG5496552.1 glucokinase [Niveispirillum sp. BGYR6]SNT03798.1 glucokinase [Azospirillum sp. RU38E]SNT19542.1 glucokinase [Azospirillum sp. RU37A]
MTDGTATNQAPFLIADIGGTNARFALVGENGAPYAEQVLRCADYPTLTDAARFYLLEQKLPVAPKVAAFAVASPILGDLIRMTNLAWEFSIKGVQHDLGLTHLDVINDFTAVALAIPELGEEDKVQVGDGAPVAGHPIAVLGPGSGLGVSALVPGDNGHWTALATEGGHVTMPPITDRESAVLAQLRKQYEHVSAERVVCGPGLVNLYETLAFLEGVEPKKLTAAEISDRAVAGRDQVCVEALDMFCAMLGSIAGNLTLSVGARGGVYIAGGIIPRFLGWFSHSRFRKRFVEKGRMRAFLGPVPTYVVTHPYPAFLGLAAKVRRAAHGG